MNVFSFTGNLGRDGTTNNVSGTAVLNFAVGVKSGFGDKEQTIWIDCALWGKQAESRLVDYMVKGQRVSVSGELGTREYPASDGTTKTAITCRVNQIGLEGSAQGSGNQPAQQQPRQQAPAPQQEAPRQAAPQQQPAPVQQQTPIDDFDDDIPF